MLSITKMELCTIREALRMLKEDNEEAKEYYKDAMEIVDGILDKGIEVIPKPVEEFIDSEGVIHELPMEAKYE